MSNEKNNYPETSTSSLDKERNLRLKTNDAMQDKE